MIPVYQTYFEYPESDCIRAVIASLLELRIGDVPNFVMTKDWELSVKRFLKRHGYQYVCKVNNVSINKFPYVDFESGVEEDIFPDLMLGGINGYFWVDVYSEDNDIERMKMDGGYTPKLHAVVCDSSLKIVHDPYCVDGRGIFTGIYPFADCVGYGGIAYINCIKKIKT